MAKKVKKTNAMRILDHEGYDYEMLSYESNDGKIDGVSVADKIGFSYEEVYKTLVTVSNNKIHYVFVIPVHLELSLKKAAQCVGEKKVEMIKVNDIMKITGYIRGGCSPIGMKKDYKVVVDEKAKALDQIIFSAGKIGQQIKMTPDDLIKVTNGQYDDITQ